jgi:two-component system, NtrC family, response regulator AtoC
MDRQSIDVLQAPPILSLVTGVGPGIRLLHDMVNEVARTEIPVLLVGESGTGKDAYARLLHQFSSRNRLPFVKCNCATFDLIPDELRQSKMNRPGAASCGTLYLDNVRELGPAAQRALCSLLPDGEDTNFCVDHIGRLISSATSSLEPDVELGRFRSELYFRLNAACLRIPPLRERVEDIPVLTEHFLNKYSTSLKKASPDLTEKAVQALSLYHWPGNIRELENFARKVVLFGDFQIALNELQAAGREAARIEPVVQVSSLKQAARAASKKAERELILLALERTRWNRKRAARDLQISYKSLLYKIKQIGVSEENHGR